MKKKSAPLIKVLVQLPNHWFLPAESLWARRVRSGQYEIRNIPFFAYDLNYGDVVLAKVESRGELPQVRSVVRRSGHRTMRVIFRDALAPPERLAVLKELRPLSVTFEGWDARYFALSIAEPDRYDAVEKRLKTLTRKGLASYETCEPRVAGSFDGVPLQKPE